MDLPLTTRLMFLLSQVLTLLSHEVFSMKKVLGKCYSLFSSWKHLCLCRHSCRV